MGQEINAGRRKVLVAGAAGLLASFGASAQFLVEVAGVGANQIPMMVLPFAGDSGDPSYGGVLASDLLTCGAFRKVEPLAGGAGGEPDLQAARAAGADIVVAGAVIRPAGHVTVRVRVYDTVRAALVEEFSRTMPTADSRMAAHQAADHVYELAMGEPWVFATRVAYIEELGRNSFRLMVSDSDGGNARVVVASKDPLISPAWSPDGRSIAYVHFGERKPIVRVVDIATRKTRDVARFRGNNSAPAFYPDGSRLAVALSMSGTTQIWTVSATDSKARANRLTSSLTIDTEPAFSADGRYVYFTSDRGGSPQIYRQPAGGGEASRMSWIAPYCISPCPSPDGKRLAYIARKDGLFRVACQDLETGAEAELTSTEQDESPSFAPNGRVIVYATTLRGKGTLSTVTVEGVVNPWPTATAGDIREPAWGPRVPVQGTRG